MLDTTLSRRSRSHLIRGRKALGDCLSTFNLLTSEVLYEEVERRLPAHRERLFPPTETLAMFVAQVMNNQRSCQSVVSQAAVQRIGLGLPKCSSHTGGYCRARQRLPVEMASGLARYLGEQIDRQVPLDWRWQGRRVRLVDGTTASMPDTAANQATYPQPSTQKPGLGFPLCRIVGITCLSSGALLDAAIGHFNGKGGSEQALLRSILDTLQTGDILLGDALFPTYFLICDLQQCGVDIVMEQHAGRKAVTDFRRGQRLGARDHLIEIRKPPHRPEWMSEAAYRSAPDSVTVREYQADGKIMVTTLTCPKNAPKVALKALYKRRWSIELDIRDIKATMEMDVLRCKTPEMVQKEIWVFLLAYNLIRWVMVQSALATGVSPRQISFKHTLQLWLHWGHVADTVDDEMLPELYALMVQKRVGNRPGRIEPRAVKRRPKNYAALNKPRPLAREHLRKHGHPVKIK